MPGKNKEDTGQNGQAVDRAEFSSDAVDAVLSDIARRPLEFCPNFPEMAERWEAWWRFEADRPLLWGTVPRPDVPPLARGAGYSLLENPAAWLGFQRRRLTSRLAIGETLPSVRVEIGPVTLAALLGAPLHFADDEQTSWQDPIIDNWDVPPVFRLDPSNRWLRVLLKLLAITAADAAGRYVVTLPDLGGAVDALANLRRPDRLCLDLLENPEAVRKTALEITAIAEQTRDLFYKTVLKHGAGVVHWLGCWSNRPYAVPTCDFSFMISPEDFRATCWPSIHAQAALAVRAVYHLDSVPRHAETLIEDPEITAIQFTPGDGTPSALAHLAMFKKIQAAGKPIIVTCPPDEIPELCRHLDRRGVVFRPTPLRSAQQAAALMKAVASA